jgi:hypothetical protein
VKVSLIRLITIGGAYGARASEGPIICFGCKRPGHIRANFPAESSKAVRRIAASKTDSEKAKPSSEVSQCIEQSEGKR